MQYPIELAGFDDQQIILDTGGFFSSPKLLVNGTPAPKGEKRGQLLLKRSDGTQATAQLRSTFIDPAPTLLVNGQKVPVVEPLKWYQLTWACIPLVLMFIGGLVGGVCGVIGAMLNIRILRSDLNSIPKLFLSGLVTLLSFLVYFILAFVLTILIRSTIPAP
jgi:hypothetical protein